MNIRIDLVLKILVHFKDRNCLYMVNIIKLFLLSISICKYTKECRIIKRERKKTKTTQGLTLYREYLFTPCLRVLRMSVIF